MVITPSCGPRPVGCAPLPVDAFRCVEHADLSGVCVGGTPTTDPLDCPFATDCNEAVRDTASNLCRYEAKCDALCGPDDLDDDGGTPGCSPCAACDPNSLTDGDGDGVPDEWEDPLVSRDWDCDGLPDGLYPENGDKDVKQLYLYIAWMSEACPGPLDTATPSFLSGLHQHQPDAATLTEIADAFRLGPEVVELEVKGRCIPHYNQIAGDFENNKDPDCDGPFDHISMRDLKARYFDGWRRGIYHFAVMAHGRQEDYPSADQQTDGVCTSTSSLGGEAEIHGDDLRTFSYHGMEFTGTGPGPSVDHAGDTLSLFHEVGHNLDLTHGGSQAAKAFNRKPNFQSAMNYRYTRLRESTGALVLDYSLVDEDPLDEQALDEVAGFVSKLAVPRRMSWTCAGGMTGFGYPDPLGTSSPSGLNWDCTGGLTAGAQSLNISGGAADQLLQGYDDWGHVDYQMYCGATNDWDDSAASHQNLPSVARYASERLVQVDVAPSCAANAVSIDDDFPVQAVLMGEASWGLEEVDRGTLRLGGARASRLEVDDIDGDGHDDLRMWFRPSSMLLLDMMSTDLFFNGVVGDFELMLAAPMVDPGDWADADGDRVVDPCDACPATPPGTAVGDNGCP